MAEPFTVPDAYPEGRYGGPSVQSGILSHAVPAGPASIADMAPLTMFTSEGRRCLVLATTHGHAAFVEDGSSYVEVAIDPSTIRDVTPPPATPEEGDRG